MTAWPAVTWTTPVLRRLDDAARTAISRSGRVVEHRAAATIYREGDPGESFFVVVDGAVDLHAVRRGDDTATVVRSARAGESFGEEVFLPGLARRLTATTTAATVVEIPVAVFQRASHRDGDGVHIDRERRYVERSAARDLLACSAFARDLDPGDVAMLLDAVQLQRVDRGTRIYEPGAAADAFYFVVDGLVQLQREDGARSTVAAYLSRGDFFGDQEALAGEPHRVTAVASGDSWCAIVPREVLRTLSDRNPGLLPRLRRVAETREASHGELIDAASARSTQHVFRDLYRMQMARSLLVIDQGTCVRCGHCAWSCEQTHGTSRLIRRGDKIVAELSGGAATLLLPNTCQHCRQAACMIDCPTGAIGRDPEGEVFIRPSLCTGCGNCAKACPWDNIQMALRPAPSKATSSTAAPPSSKLALSADIAVKCDLCRGYDAPACVEACPVGAVMRLDPQRDVAEVAKILGLPGRSTAAPRSVSAKTPAAGLAGRDVAPDRDGPTPPRTAARRGPRTPLASASLAGAIAIAAGGWALHHRYGWAPSHGPGLVAGLIAAVVVAALAAYVVPKRLLAKARPIDAASKRTAANRAVLDAGSASRSTSASTSTRPAPRSRLRPHFFIHLVLGAIVPAAALAHAGLRFHDGTGGALASALGITVLVGVISAVMYRIVPRALTRLERRGVLPEDLRGERETLEARLYQAVTGKSDRVKSLVDRILMPYARAGFGPARLLGSGLRLADEQRRFRAEIDQALAGRTPEGADELIAIAVEIRALPARRLLGHMLRVGPPIHAVTSAMTLALLVVHVVAAVVR